jgi:hypothetical protein
MFSIEFRYYLCFLRLELGLGWAAMAKKRAQTTCLEVRPFFFLISYIN